VHWQQGPERFRRLGRGVAFILVIFLCVVLHEFGHALTARRYGIRTRDIILLPIGGVARLERIPTNPIQELWVALAGPAVNVVIVVALFIWLKLTASLEPLQTLTITTGPFMERIMAVNIFMVVFNMIPAFPMDGGRVLRALLATRREYGRATQIAASIGQGIAVLFGFIGLVLQPVSAFHRSVCLDRRSPGSQHGPIKSAIGGIPVQQAMISDFKALDLNDRLNRAVELTLTGSQKDFPVVNNGSLEGILTQTDLLKALSDRENYPTVESAIQKDYATVDHLDMLESAFTKLSNCNCHTLPVMQNGKLVGLVTMDNLGEYMRIQAAMSH
jgi:Zn-dependent protease/predicted transcriptional regulator